MTSSLVGSEMCIRDSTICWRAAPGRAGMLDTTVYVVSWQSGLLAVAWKDCLLYTSDAADDM
eukprot:12396139-Prorocentrum_lima.AAC.1